MELNISGNVVQTENVVAIVEGSEKPNEYIIISSHLDLRRKNGVIYNGADDNASGTIGVLKIAAAFQNAVLSGHRPKRSLVFLHLTGEEKGLLGSKFYTDNPLYPLENTMVNLNIDMIGRIDPRHINKLERYIYLIGLIFLVQNYMKYQSQQTRIPQNYILITNTTILINQNAFTTEVTIFILSKIIFQQYFISMVFIKIIINQLIQLKK